MCYDEVFSLLDFLLAFCVSLLTRPFIESVKRDPFLTKASNQNAALWVNR